MVKDDAKIGASKALRILDKMQDRCFPTASLALGGPSEVCWMSAEAKVGASPVQTMESCVSRTIRFMAQQL